MPEDLYVEAVRGRVLIRLDTLIRLRWSAIAGQFGAVLIVAFGFGYAMPWMICLSLIAVSALLNIFLTMRYRTNTRFESSGAFALLAFDILQLAVLLYLTGGIHNPFSILLMAPVIVSSTSLRGKHTLLLGTFALALTAFLTFYHLPLPWEDGTPFDLPTRYEIGIWIAISCTLAFTAIYAFRVAQEAEKLGDALAATELVLQREQHLSALDGMAAAAAHELGTPLATIALVSKEMLHTLPEDSALAEDAALLRSQAQRCRDILQKLTSLSSDGEPIMERQPLPAMVEEVVAPHRNFGIDIEIVMHGGDTNPPDLQRNAGIHYGLGNLIDNAVDFARSRVVIEVAWSQSEASVTITDDGSGFPPSIVDKLGEPFVSSRKRQTGSRPRGLGLGLFIAKTLLKRSGGSLAFMNLKSRTGETSGARAKVTWPRQRLEV